MSSDYPPNYDVAEALIDHHKKWLDSAAKKSVQNANTKNEATKALAGEIEKFVSEQFEATYNKAPPVILAAMWWEVDVELDYETIARLLIDPYWNAKLAKSNNVKPRTSKGSKNTNKTPKNKSNNGKTSRRN